MACLYIVLGIRPIAEGIMIANGPLGSMFAGVGAVAIIIGLVGVLVGIGLILKIPFVRTVSVYFNWLKVLGGAMGVWSSLLMFSPLGILWGLLDVGTAGFMIYLVAETDTIAEL